MIREYLTTILNKGYIGSSKDFKAFWLCYDLLDDKSPYDIDYNATFTPSMSILLKEGVATLLIEPIKESEITLDSFCRYTCKHNASILFNDYDGICYDSYADLQLSYVEKQLDYYKTVLPSDYEMTIGELDEICYNAEDWKAGKNYTHFLDEGRILVEGFPVGDDYYGIYADFEVLSGYEVTDSKTDAEYFKDFKVRINFVYSEKVW